MERFFVIFIFLFLTSCQSLTKLDIDVSTELNAETAFDAPEIIIEKTPELVWDYLQDNAVIKNHKLTNIAQKYIYEYTKNIYLFEKYIERSEYYIFFVIQELEKKDLPVEFAFIPFIESNYDPFSISASGAVGLWQFMPRTGESLNLNKTWWIEERHDPF